MFLLSWTLGAESHFYQACRAQESEDIRTLQPVEFIPQLLPPTI